MPILVKIFKVIINELANDIEILNATQDTEVSNIRFLSVYPYSSLFYFLFSILLYQNEDIISMPRTLTMKMRTKTMMNW